MSAAILLLAAGIAAYTNSFSGAFVFDDGPAIVDNPHLRSVWPLSHSMTAPAEAPISGRPIGSLSFALNYAAAPAGALGATAPWSYHFVNLAIHLLAALTLFGILRRTLRSARLIERFGAAATPLAFLVALLWELHPLQTESVTYLVQRVESLMGLFYLLTLYCSIRALGAMEPWAFSRGAQSSARAAARGWIAAAIAGCALGMGTKEVMVSAPIVVCLWAWIFRAPSAERPAPRSLLIGLVSTWGILVLLVLFEHRSHSVGFYTLGWTPWAYLLTQAAVIVHYLRLAFVPTSLVLDYGWPTVRSLAVVWPQALLLIALLGLTIWAVLRRHPLGFAGACFFLILAPSSSILPVATEVAAEHRMYLPLAAIVASAVAGAYTLLSSAGGADLQVRPKAQGSMSLVFAAVSAVAVAAWFGTLTSARNRDYVSEVSIWADTVEKRPENPRAQLNYGAALMSQMRFAEAEDHLRIAERLAPDDDEVQANLGSALASQNNFAEAIPRLERAASRRPSDAEIQRNLAEAYAATQRPADALRAYLRALELTPDDPFLLNRAGWLMATSADSTNRNGARAVELATRAVRLTSGQDVISLDTLAAANAELDRFDEAAALGRQALALAKAQGNQAMLGELGARVASYDRREKVRQ